MHVRNDLSKHLFCGALVRLQRGISDGSVVKLSAPLYTHHATTVIELPRNEEIRLKSVGHNFAACSGGGGHQAFALTESM